jgi:serine protease Do
MSLQTITPTMAASLVLPRDYGVIVSDVWPGGPAEAAGLKVGDVLMSVDGEPADNLPTVVYSFRLRDSTNPVRLEVMSGGKQQTLSITPVEMRSDFDSVSALADPEKNMIPELGIIAVEIDPRIAASATGLRDPSGVIVVARTAGGSGDVPLQPKDVIRRLNNLKISTLQELRDAMRPLTPGSPVTIQIQREERLMYLSFTFER